MSKFFQLLLGTTGLAAVTMAMPADSAAQSVRAVHLSGTACQINNNVQAPFPSSSSGEVSAWVGFQTIGPGEVQTLVQSHTNGVGATTVLDFHIENTVGQPGLANGSHLFLITTDGTPPGPAQQYSQWVSNEILDVTGWHHPYIAWDTSQVFTNGTYTVVGFFDGIELTPNPTYTHGNTSTQNFFTTPYFKNNLNNSYAVGCYHNPVTSAYTSFYHGDLAETYVTPLASATVPDLTPFGFFSLLTGLWGPKELGNYCLVPNAGVDPPLLCLRGPPNQFKYNLWPSTTTLFTNIPGGNSPTLASDDPFIAIP